jgi:CBS domain containing-hemolysin-like protein
MSLTYALLLLLLALGGVVVRKTYYALPAHELKRKAESHDHVAVQLYRAVAYGSSLRSLLWLYIGFTSAASLILLARLLPVWAGLLIVGPLLWAAFSWLPASRTTRLGTRLTLLVTPPIVWLLNYLHPPLSRSAKVIQNRAKDAHTGLFERGDLLALIEQQQQQLDNRLSDEELEIVKRALSFSEYSVGDLLTPRKKVKTLKPSDTIGPILINELHKSGGGYALVREKPKAEILGSVAFSQLDLHSTGTVAGVMNTTVYYLHEMDSLSDALHAFFVTNHPVFVVVNGFEEYVGIVTIQSILKLLMGHVPGDDFDQYANPVAVAARHSKPAESAEPEKPDETPEEVVE